MHDVAPSITDWLTGIGTVGLALAALVQLPIVIFQVRELSLQIKLSREAEERAELQKCQWETQSVCQRYDFDPVIDAACKRITDAASERTAKGGAFDAYTTSDERDMVVILNYFDGIAIGIEHGLYLDSMVKQQLGNLIDEAVRDWIDTGIIRPTGLECLVKRHALWFRPKPSVLDGRSKGA